MVDYPTDLDLNPSKDIHLDGANDLALISGIGQLQQSVAIDVMDELQDFIGGAVTGEQIGLLEEAIREGLNEDPQLDEVVSLTITEYDKAAQTLTIEGRTVENEDFTLPEVSA